MLLNSLQGSGGLCSHIEVGWCSLIFSFVFSQLDILCNEEILGKDHTLKFVVVTRWRFKVSRAKQTQILHHNVGDILQASVAVLICWPNRIQSYQTLIGLIQFWLILVKSLKQKKKIFRALDLFRFIKMMATCIDNANLVHPHQLMMIHAEKVWYHMEIN